VAETNIGFDANSGIGEADWATLSPGLGNALAVVESESSRKVTIGANPMTVDVAPGVTYAFGERHSDTSVTNKTIGAVSLTGASRWDAIVERRAWSSNAVTVEVVPGTASVGAPEVPPTLNATPGNTYDQLLALVKATNGSTALTVSDKRLWASKIFSVNTVTGLPTASAALYGAVCYVIATKTVYRCLLPSGSPGWVPDAAANVVLAGTDVISAAPNWTLIQSTGSQVLLPCRGMYNAVSGMVQIDFQIRRSAVTITPFSDPGGVPVATVGTLPAVLCPDADVVPMPFTGQYTTSAGSVNSWRNISLTVTSTGVITLHQVSAEALAAVASGPSIRAHLTFFKRTI
jgi:hypothetical protein